MSIRCFLNPKFEYLNETIKIFLTIKIKVENLANSRILIEIIFYVR